MIQKDNIVLFTIVLPSRNLHVIILKVKIFNKNNDKFHVYKKSVLNKDTLTL